MLAGLVIVPVVSFITPKLEKNFVERAFSCYEKKVEVVQKKTLGRLRKSFNIPNLSLIRAVSISCFMDWKLPVLCLNLDNCSLSLFFWNDYIIILNGNDILQMHIQVFVKIESTDSALPKRGDNMLELPNISFDVADNKKKVGILKNVSLTLEDNKFIVVTGPNGGGKSTLAKIIAGIEKPTAGQILWNGEDITQWSVTERANLGISYAFQQPVRFKGITVYDLIQLATGRPNFKGRKLVSICRR